MELDWLDHGDVRTEQETTCGSCAGRGSGVRGSQGCFISCEICHGNLGLIKGEDRFVLVSIV
jgi:hypothetical protein